MSRARQDFVVDANKAQTLSFTVDGAQFESVNNLTWRIAQTPDGNSVVEKTTGSGITVIDDENLTIDIESADFTDPGLYYHVLYQTVSGTDSMLARGRAFVRPLPAGVSA